MATGNARSRRILGVVLLFPVILAAAGGCWFWYHATYHYQAVQSGVLYRSGNNSLRRLKIALDDAHIRTVVALIDDRELADPSKPQFAQEKAYAEAHGLRYIRIPVRLGGWPNSAQIQQFLHITGDRANQPVLVHCAQGVRRTGMFVAAFEESQLGWSASQTKSAIVPFGHGPSTVQNIDTFIERYDPKAERFDSSGLGKAAEE